MEIRARAVEGGEKVSISLRGADHKGIVHAVVSVLADLSFSIERADVKTEEGMASDEFLCVPPCNRMSSTDDLEKLIRSRLGMYSDFRGEVTGLLLSAPLFRSNETEVWRGMWGQTKVAVKITTSRGKEEKLKEEMAIWKQLKHPNICTFYGLCSFHGGGERIGIVMELCCTDLRERVHSSSSRIRRRTKLCWMRDLASALSHVHAMQIIHRDVKPANVLLDGSERVRLADFGLSRMTCDTLHNTGETGTYRYMAPEVIRSDPYSEECDSFSFGMTMWEVWTRERPFVNLSPLQTAYAIASGIRPDMKKVRKEEGVRNVISKCMEHDPEERMRMVEAMKSISSMIRARSSCAPW